MPKQFGEFRISKNLYGLRKDGERFPIETSLSYLKLDGNMIAFATVRDVTDRRILEEQLRLKNETLLLQNEQVLAATRMKSEFLANMSHELRTPLNGIIGFAELMYSGAVGSLSPEHKEYLGDILKSAHHLLHLINDVLDLSKVESGKMEFFPEEINIADLINEVCDILRTTINKYHIIIKINIDSKLGSIIIDASKLKQILYNLLSNAVKLSPDNDVVEISVNTEGDHFFRLSVKDNGIGISEKDQAKLFTEFQQLDAGISKKYQGTGLGLALSKRIVEAQGGLIGVISRMNKGSIFYVILPKHHQF